MRLVKYFAVQLLSWRFSFCFYRFLWRRSGRTVSFYLRKGLPVKHHRLKHGAAVELDRYFAYSKKVCAHLSPLMLWRSIKLRFSRRPEMSCVNVKNSYSYVTVLHRSGSSEGCSIRLTSLHINARRGKKGKQWNISLLISLSQISFKWIKSHFIFYFHRSDKTITLVLGWFGFLTDISVSCVVVFLPRRLFAGAQRTSCGPWWPHRLFGVTEDLTGLTVWCWTIIW